MKVAIILAGGRGTRLGSELPPKAMLTVNQRTLIDHQLDWLEQEGFDKVFLCLGHRHAEVSFEKKKFNVVPIVEKKALGTGGAVCNVYTQFKNDFVDGAYIFNVDDLTNIDTSKVFAKSSNLDKSIVVVKSIPFGVWVGSNFFQQHLTSQHLGHTFLRFDELSTLPTNDGSPLECSLEKQLSLWSQTNLIETFPHDGFWLTVNDKEQLSSAQKQLSNLTKTN